MKNLLSLFSFFFLANLSAQNCEGFYPLIKGKTYEMENFNGKDKKTGRLVYTVLNVENKNGKTKASMTTDLYDEKDKATSHADYTVLCDKSTIFVDMRTFIPPHQSEAYKNMEIKADGNYLQTPSKLTIGQTLPDGEMKMDMIDKKSGSTSLSTHIKIHNREVKGKESITTPAGTFDCYKITYDGTMETKMVAVPIPMPTFHYNVIEYLSPGNGIIKTITYGKNEKLLGYSQLTKK